MRSILSFCIFTVVLALFSSGVSAQTFNLELNIDGATYHQTHTVLPLPPLGGGSAPIICNDYSVIGEFHDYSWRPAHLDFLRWETDDGVIVVELPVYIFIYTLHNGSELRFLCFRNGSVSARQDDVEVADGTYSWH